MRQVISGVDLMRHPKYNKGLAFSDSERDRLYLRGLLPPVTLSQVGPLACSLGARDGIGAMGQAVPARPAAAGHAVTGVQGRTRVVWIEKEGGEGRGLPGPGVLLGPMSTGSEKRTGPRCVCQAYAPAMAQAQEVQLERTMLNIRSKESDLEKYIYLQGLQVGWAVQGLRLGQHMGSVMKGSVTS